MFEKSKSVLMSKTGKVIGTVMAGGVIIPASHADSGSILDLATTVGDGAISNATSIGASPIGWVAYFVLGLAIFSLVIYAIRSNLSKRG